MMISYNMRYQMISKSDNRSCNRLRSRAIVRLEEEPKAHHFYYAMMHNYSCNGMYFESLFSLNPGSKVKIKVENPPLADVPPVMSAQVKWCRELLNDNSFYCYGIGVEYSPEPSQKCLSIFED